MNIILAPNEHNVVLPLEIHSIAVAPTERDIELRQDIYVSLALHEQTVALEDAS